MKKLIIIVVVLSTFACNNETKKVEKEIDTTAEFAAFKRDFLDEMWKQYPINASYNGVHLYDSLLPIPNKARRVANSDFSKMWLKKLKSFDLDKLNDNDKIDFYLIHDELYANEFYAEDFKNETWNPAMYNLGGVFYQVINYREHPINKRLTDIFFKLDGVPDYYAAAKENINQPTKVHTELAIQQLEGSKNVFLKTLMDSLQKSTLDTNFKADFEKKINTAVEEIDHYIIFLVENFINKTADSATFRSFRIGEELYAEKFKYQIQSEFTAKEIFEAAVEEKQKLHENLFRLSNDLWEKYYPDQEKPGQTFKQIQMVIDAVSKTHVHRDSFVSSIRQQIPELIKFVKEHDLLTLDSTKPLIVRETPEYMRGFAGASISAPGPYDAEAETYYNVTPLDNYNDEEAESYLREYNNFTLQILNIHEAIPGHYTQLVYANESPSIIKSVMGNGAMIEGWAVYTEKMMLEEGYGGDNLEMGLMYYKWNLRTVCNTILDYGIHNLNLSEEEAMQLLMVEAFQEKSEAEGKWKRARLSQVQLCSYFTGYYEIMKLRDEIQERMGEAFDLKAFHEEFLSYGSAPVKYIKQLMLNNLESKNKSKKVES